MNHKSKKDHQSNNGNNVEPELVKPTLEQFYKAFQDQVYQVNKTYKNSKADFEKDMKAFKDYEIIDEENEMDEEFANQQAIA